MRRIFAPLAIVIATGAIAAGGIVISQGGGGSPAPTGTANIWIQNGGGTCTGGRSATAIAFSAASSPDRICGTFDLAWDAMNAGDTARIVASTSYAAQTITGNKASATYLIAEDGTEMTDTLEVQGNFFNIENLIIDIGCGIDEGQTSGAYIQGTDVTWTDVDLWGCRASMQTGPAFLGGNGGDRFYWRRGTFGEPGTTGAGRDTTDGEPMYLYGGDDITIDGVTFAPQSARNGFHLETIRLQGDSPENLLRPTIKNSIFVSGSSVGSGYIFITDVAPSVVAANGFRLMNNVFGEGINGSATMQAQDNIDSTSGWVFAYNTWEVPNNPSPGIFLGGGSTAGGSIVWVGNNGPKTEAGCSGTYIRNVWQNNTNVACGSDTWVNGPLGGTGNLGISADQLTLTAGSPSINSGEVPSASDYCTNPAYLNSLDRAGQSRPAGSACDAGSHERE